MLRSTLASVKAMPSRVAVPLAVLLLAFAWVYWPTFVVMNHQWFHEPQYAHGYLVPLFSLFLLWRRRALLAAVASQYNWWGAGLVVVAAALRVAGAYFYSDWLDAASLVPCLAGFCVLLGGWSAFRWAWPALAFLFFMIPLPFRIETAFGATLQSIATATSTYTLQTIGLPVLAEGNIIILNHGRIGVAEACSGLSMLTTFLALAAAVALLVRRPWLDRTVIVLSAVPIAVLANVARITATALAQEWFGREAAHAIFHDLAGWLMMPFALVVLWAELRLLSFLLVEPPASVSPPSPAKMAAGTVPGPRDNARPLVPKPAVFH